MAKNSSIGSHGKFLLAFFILVGFLAFFALSAGFFLQQKSTNTPVNFSIPALNGIYQEAQPLVSEENVLKEEHNSDVWWVAEDGYNILVPGQSVVFSVIDNDEEAPAVEEDGKDPIFAFILSQPNMQAFYDLSVNALTEAGFTKNEHNSSPSLSQTDFYSHVAAYEKAGTRCTVTIDPDLVLADESENSKEVYYSQIVTACTNDFQSAYNLQAPILKALRTKAAAVSLMNSEGDFYNITLHSRWANTDEVHDYVIMQKVGDTYREIFSGRDLPPCNLMMQNNVPKSVYNDSCFDQATQSERSTN